MTCLVRLQPGNWIGNLPVVRAGLVVLEHLRFSRRVSNYRFRLFFFLHPKHLALTLFLSFSIVRVCVHRSAALAKASPSWRWRLTILNCLAGGGCRGVDGC